MWQAMTENITDTSSTAPLKLAELDMAALLCSRLCHDIISPVGAIINGLEVLADDDDEKMRGFAMELIQKSADQASAKLQFSRLAFGAAGSAAAMIDLADLEAVARGFAASGKLSVTWEAPVGLVGKDNGKLLLNMVLVGLQAIPAGGELAVRVGGELDIPQMSVACTGPGARVPPQILELLDGRVAADAIDARSIQPYFTGLVARSIDRTVSVVLQDGCVTVSALPA